MEMPLYNLLLVLIFIGALFVVFGLTNDAFFNLAGISIGIGDVGVLIIFGAIEIITFYLRNKTKNEH